MAFFLFTPGGDGVPVCQTGCVQTHTLQENERCTKEERGKAQAVTVGDLYGCAPQHVFTPIPFSIAGNIPTTTTAEAQRWLGSIPQSHSFWLCRVSILNIHLCPSPPAISFRFLPTSLCNPPHSSCAAAVEASMPGQLTQYEEEVRTRAESTSSLSDKDVKVEHCSQVLSSRLNYPHLLPHVFLRWKLRTTIGLMMPLRSVSGFSTSFILVFNPFTAEKPRAGMNFPQNAYYTSQS